MDLYLKIYILINFINIIMLNYVIINERIYCIFESKNKMSILFNIHIFKQ